jgi:hypothetical protein
MRAGDAATLAGRGHLGRLLVGRRAVAGTKAGREGEADADESDFPHVLGSFVM